MILYINESADNVIGKVLKRVGNVSIRLPATIDVINPVLKLTGIVESFNYCYIPELERYYFVKSAKVRGRFMELFLAVDVLETYKDKLLDTIFTVEVEIGDGDYGIINAENTTKFINKKYVSDIELIPSKNILFTTVGEGENG